MKDYNQKFDSGFTLTGKGKPTEKDSPVLQACGDLDELSSLLGLAKAFLENKEIRDALDCIQRDLILAMGDLASEGKSLEEKHVKGLEGMILKYEKVIEAPKDWVIPGKSKPEAVLHVSRAVSRRAERAVLTARKKEEVNFEILRYLNRLSDLLFIFSQMKEL
jgi:cob(I)alamin adenosyltransferase